jgi:hypothetical protein
VENNRRAVAAVVLEVHPAPVPPIHRVGHGLEILGRTSRSGVEGGAWPSADQPPGRSDRFRRSEIGFRARGSALLLRLGCESTGTVAPDARPGRRAGIWRISAVASAIRGGCGTSRVCPAARRRKETAATARPAASSDAGRTDLCRHLGRRVDSDEGESAALVSTALAVAVTGCGGSEIDAPERGAVSRAAVESKEYVASPTLGRGSAKRLFAIAGLGRFGASCRRPGQAEISYLVAPGSATQLVTTETARAGWSNGWLDPGQRVAVAISPQTRPRTDWQVALLSKGRIEVLTASFTVSPLAKFGCFVTGKAEVASRRR